MHSAIRSNTRRRYYMCLEYNVRNNRRTQEIGIVKTYKKKHGKYTH